jgi:hypothetical protein
LIFGFSSVITNTFILEIYPNAATKGSLGWSFGDNDDNPWQWDANKNNGLSYLYWQEL